MGPSSRVQSPGPSRAPEGLEVGMPSQGWLCTQAWASWPTSLFLCPSPFTKRSPRPSYYQGLLSTRNPQGQSHPQARGPGDNRARLGKHWPARRQGATSSSAVTSGWLGFCFDPLRENWEAVSVLAPRVLGRTPAGPGMAPESPRNSYPDFCRWCAGRGGMGEQGI